jgi:isopentenyldiphosphate isomerase
MGLIILGEINSKNKSKTHRHSHRQNRMEAILSAWYLARNNTELITKRNQVKSPTRWRNTLCRVFSTKRQPAIR